MSIDGDFDDATSANASERFDIKAYQPNSYFPEGRRELSHEEWL